MFIWGSGDLLDWIIFEIIPAVPKFLCYFPPFPLPPRKHGCDLASFPQFPPSLCSNSLPISTADDCRRKKTKITPWADVKSDFEVKCQQAVVRLSSHREAETSLRDRKEPGREVMVKDLPHLAVPSTLGCKPQLGNLPSGPQNLTIIW